MVRPRFLPSRPCLPLPPCEQAVVPGEWCRWASISSSSCSRSCVVAVLLRTGCSGFVRRVAIAPMATHSIPTRTNRSSTMRYAPQFFE